MVPAAGDAHGRKRQRINIGKAGLGWAPVMDGLECTNNIRRVRLTFKGKGGGIRVATIRMAFVVSNDYLDEIAVCQMHGGNLALRDQDVIVPQTASFRISRQ